MSKLSDKLKKLNQAVHELASATDQQQLMERTLDVIKQVFARQTAAVLLRDPDGQHLTIQASRGYDPEVVASYHAPVGRGVAGIVAATGEPRLVPDVTQEPDYVPGVHAAISEMAVPLTVDGEVIGVLDLESRERAFDEEDMALLVAFGEQVAWAMRHSMVLAQSEARARRLELLNRGARALNAIHDPDRLLDRILEFASRALGFNNVAVLLVDEKKKYLEVKRALRPKGSEGLKVPVGEGIAGTVFRTGRAEIVPDVTTDPRYIAGGLEGTRSEIVAPLNLDGEVIGVLDAEGECIESFGPMALETFSAFAAQVATAVRNAQLMQDLEVRAQRLKQIARITRALNTILDTDELLAQILEAAAKALDLERVAILLYDPEQSELVIHAARGYADVIGQRIDLGQGVTGHVAQTGEPVLLNDVKTDERYLPGIERGASEMAVPLQVHGELFGVLDTESPEPDGFSRQDLELFQVFADQAAVALNNARLFARLELANIQLKRNLEEMSRLNRELEAYASQISETNASLEQQIKQLTALHQAGQTITSSLDLAQTLEAILTMSSEIVASSSGAISLIDEETKELRVMAQAGISREITGSVRKYDLPLKIGQRTIGVFELIRKANVKLDDSERKMLETLASQAAVAIENARLFEDTQRIYYETLKSLARALEARDDYTRGHSERVADLSLAIAQDMGLDDDQCHLIFNSALLHDIGKIGVRDSILLKPHSLSMTELEVIRKHPTYGNAILGPLKFLGDVAELVKCHHECWDGSGYPEGLKGEQIPLASRIISVADSFDAMTSDRPYREARTQQDAIEEIRREAGRQLDPKVVETFFRVIEKRQPQDPPAEGPGDVPQPGT